MVAPPQNLHFSKKHWFLQCFRHILTSRFGKLRLGGHISSSYIKINDIHCTTKKCGMFRNTSVSKTEKLKNWKTVFSRDIQEEILHKKTVFQFFSFVSGNVPEEFRKQNWKTEKLFFPETSRERFSIKKQFFSFSVLSPEMFRKSSVSKTEKLKNCFFQRHPGRDSP